VTRVRLTPGHRLGPYEIVALLGAGGMGEVYRARDTRLDREVAIKVLPADRLTDAERRWRFMQEARAASALNHPHIVTIHEIDVADGVDFMVMELVAGRTLDELIPKHGMSLSELLLVATPLADALASAHAHGIVHRDLKPSNVMVASPGRVKVVDFGLAELVGRPNPSDGPETVTLAVPHEPSTFGTPPYMSPEQVAGRPVDARSDIFSFGALLYEMATGRRAFDRPSGSETLAAVLHDQPAAPRALVPAMPEALERIILRCLKKDPDRRFQHASDLKVELDELREEGSAAASAPVAAKRFTLASRRVSMVIAAALVAAVAVGYWRVDDPAPSPVITRLTSEHDAGAGSFSPDGTQIAYASLSDDGTNWDIRTRIIGAPEVRRLTTHSANEQSPAWSPDGTQIAFLRYEQGASNEEPWKARPATVHVVSALGGAARRVSPLPARTQLSWSPDSAWLAVATVPSVGEVPGAIYLISMATGEARAITRPAPPTFHLAPTFAADGRAVAYASCQRLDGCNVYVVHLDADMHPLATTGPLLRQPVPITGTAWTRDGRWIVYANFAWAEELNTLWRVRVTGRGAPERIELGGRAQFPSLATRLDRLAFVRHHQDADIYRLLPGIAASAVVNSTRVEFHPRYSPDGRRIAFESGGPSGGSEIWLAAADGSNPVRLTRAPGRGQGSPAWAPDGRSIAFDAHGEDGPRAIWLIAVDGTGLRRVTHGAGDDMVPAFSRDGRFIYFQSTRTGRAEIWRVSTAGGAEEQLTTDGGTSAEESLDGRTLYYLQSDPGPLRARPVSGGAARVVIACTRRVTFAVGKAGIVYRPCEDGDASDRSAQPLLYWDAATGRSREIGTIGPGRLQGLSVLSDDSSIVYALYRSPGDLMMVDHFQ
jgi:Tol biopolymer transport system component